MRSLEPSASTHFSDPGTGSTSFRKIGVWAVEACKVKSSSTTLARPPRDGEKRVRPCEGQPREGECLEAPYREPTILRITRQLTAEYTGT